MTREQLVEHAPLIQRPGAHSLPSNRVAIIERVDERAPGGSARWLRGRRGQQQRTLQQALAAFAACDPS
jgi:hypothetical protein